MSKNSYQFKPFMRNRKGNIWTWFLFLFLLMLLGAVLCIGMDFGIRTMCLGRVQHAANEAALTYARALVKLRDNRLSKANQGTLQAIGAQGIANADLSNIKAIDFSFAGLESLLNPGATSTPTVSKASIPGASSLEYTEASQVLLYNIWKDKIQDSSAVNDVRQNQCYVPHAESRFSLNKSAEENVCVANNKILSPLMSLRWVFTSSAYGQGPCCDKAAKCGASGNDFCVVVKVTGRIDPVLAGGLPFLHELGIIKDGRFTIQARAVVKKMVENAALGENVSDDTVSLQANQPQVCEFSCPYPPKINPPGPDAPVDALVNVGQIDSSGLQKCMENPDGCIRNEPSADCDPKAFPEYEYRTWNPDLIIGRDANGAVISIQDPGSQNVYKTGYEHFNAEGKKQGRLITILTPEGQMVANCQHLACGKGCANSTQCQGKDGCTKCSEEKICVEPPCGDTCNQDDECWGAVKGGCPSCVNHKCGPKPPCPPIDCTDDKTCQVAGGTNCVCSKPPGSSTGKCDANCPIISCVSSRPCQAVGGAKCVCDTDKTNTCQKCLDVKCNNDSDCSSMAGSDCKCDSSTKKCKVVDPPCPATCGPDCTANPKCQCVGSICKPKCPPKCGKECTDAGCECDSTTQTCKAKCPDIECSNKADCLVGGGANCECIKKNGEPKGRCGPPPCNTATCKKDSDCANASVSAISTWSKIPLEDCKCHPFDPITGEGVCLACENKDCKEDNDCAKAGKGTNCTCEEVKIDGTVKKKCTTCPTKTCTKDTDCEAGGTGCTCDLTTLTCTPDPCPKKCGPECTAKPECQCDGDLCEPKCPPKCGPDCTKAGCICKDNKCTKDDDPCGKKCEKVEDCKGVLACPLCATAPTSPNQTVCTDCGKSCTQGAECAGSKTGCTVCDGGVCKPPECGDPCALDANCQSIDEYVRQGIAAPNSCVKCSLINLTCITDRCGTPCKTSKECPSSTCPICSNDEKCISDKCNEPCNFDQECANSEEGCNKCINGTCGKAGCAWDVNNLIPSDIDPVPPPGANRIKECDMKNLSGTNNIDSAFCGKDGDLCIAPWVEPAPADIFPGLTDANKQENAVKVFKCACNSPNGGLTWDFQRYAFPWDSMGSCPPVGSTGQVDNTTCSKDGDLCKTVEWHIFGHKVFKCEKTTNTTGAEECRWDLNTFTTMSLKKGSACKPDANNPDKYNNVACSKAEEGQICYKPEAEPYTIGQLEKGWRKIFQCDCAPTAAATTRSCSWDVNGFADPNTQPSAEYPQCSFDPNIQKYIDGSECQDTGTGTACLTPWIEKPSDQNGSCTNGYCSNFDGKACSTAEDCSATFPYSSSDGNQQMVKLYRCSCGSSTASWDFQRFLDVNSADDMKLPTCPDAATLPGQKVDNSSCNASSDDRCRTGDRIFRCEPPLAGCRLDLNNFTAEDAPLPECPENNNTVNNVDCTSQGEGWRCKKMGAEADRPTLDQLRNNGWKKIFRCDCNETLPSTGTPSTPPPTTTTSIPTPTPTPNTPISTPTTNTPPPTPTPNSIPTPPTVPTPPPIPTPPPAYVPPEPITVPVPTPTTPPPQTCPAGQELKQETNTLTGQPYTRCVLTCPAGTHLSSITNFDNSVTDTCVPDSSSTSTECDPGFHKYVVQGNFTPSAGSNSPTAPKPGDCVPDEPDGSSWIDQSGGSGSNCLKLYASDLNGGQSVGEQCFTDEELERAKDTGYCSSSGCQCDVQDTRGTNKTDSDTSSCTYSNFANTPLVIVFDSIDKIKLETIVEFSFDGKNKLKTYWINPNLNLAYLIYDFNQNGLVDDGTELFGNHTNNKQYANGFEALADFKDADKNGIIEAHELKGLMLWFDKNANAITDKGELIALTSKGIQKISFKDLINTQKFFGANGYALPYVLNGAYSSDGKFDVLDLWFKEVK